MEMLKKTTLILFLISLNLQSQPIPLPVDSMPNGPVDCLGSDVSDILSWIGDGFCDDGAYSWNGNYIYFNCPEFNFDDGDCPIAIVDTIYGCMNFMALNFVPEANIDDNSCEVPVIGCTDPEAINYNPLAQIDNGGCANIECSDGEAKMLLEVTLDQYPGETGWILTDISTGQPVESVQAGEYSYDQANTTIPYQLCVPEAGVELILSDTYGDGMIGSMGNQNDDGGFVILGDLEPCGSPDVVWELPDANFGSVAYSGVIQLEHCDIPIEYGCMNNGYMEFNPFAQVDDGSCETEHIVGCIDWNAYNYDSVATLNDIVPVCEYRLVLNDSGGDGWGDSQLAITQGDSLVGVYTLGPGIYEEVKWLYLRTDMSVQIRYFEIGPPQVPQEELEFQTMHNSFFLFNDALDLLISGGANPFAFNGAGALQPFEPPFWHVYSALPYCGDYCIDVVEGCMDPEAFNYDPLANTDYGYCIAAVEGCTNELAFNYDSLANIDDESCQSYVYGCMDVDAWNYNDLANTSDESCLYFGCMDPEADNYDPNANVDNGACFTTILGCTDPEAFNYSEEANTDDFSCVPVIYGCLDSAAFNYDSIANTSNDNCLEVIEGCMDNTAYNYDAFANTDSYDCLYDAGCIDGPGVPYWSNDTCYSWVIMVDPYCCNNSWDEKCQQLYWHCSGDSPLDTRDLLRGHNIVMYPNPMGDVLNILTNGPVSLKAYDMTGKLVIKVKTNQTHKGLNQLDVSLLPTGIYTFKVTYEGRVNTTKVLKK